MNAQTAPVIRSQHTLSEKARQLLDAHDREISDPVSESKPKLPFYEYRLAS